MKKVKNQSTVAPEKRIVTANTVCLNTNVKVVHKKNRHQDTEETIYEYDTTIMSHQEYIEHLAAAEDTNSSAIAALLEMQLGGAK